MSVTWPDVVTIAPELASVDAVTGAETLVDCTALIDPDVWEGKTDLGVKYLCAHFVTMDQRRKGVGGAMNQQTVGAVSRGLNTGDFLGDLQATSYGQRFELLMYACAATRFDVA